MTIKRGNVNLADKVYEKSQNFVSRKIADEIILVPIKRDAGELDAIYNLNNEVSVRIWELINGKRSLKEVKQKILEEFDITEQRLVKDLKKFIKDLEDIEAIIIKKI